MPPSLFVYLVYSSLISLVFYLSELTDYPYYNNKIMLAHCFVYPLIILFNSWLLGIVFKNITADDEISEVARTFGKSVWPVMVNLIILSIASYCGFSINPYLIVIIFFILVSTKAFSNVKKTGPLNGLIFYILFVLLVLKSSILDFLNDK